MVQERGSNEQPYDPERDELVLMTFMILDARPILGADIVEIKTAPDGTRRLGGPWDDMPME